jgi:hypothetical protein
MKRYVLCILLVVACNLLLAQGIRLNVYSAYVFDDYFEAYTDSYNYYHGTIKGGYQWGAGLEYLLRPEYSIEVLYQRQDTHAPSTWQNGQGSITNTNDLNVDLNYIMLAGNRHLVKADGKLETYAGLLAGVGVMNISNDTKSTSLTKFSWGLRAGVNIWVKPQVGLKIQAQLLSAVQAAGGGAYFGTSGGGVGVSTYSTIYQFSLGGGLAFKLGKQNDAK